MNLNTDYFAVFALIVILEAPLVWFRGVNSELKATWEKLDLLKVITMVTLVNAMIHPLVFFGFLASGKPYLWVTLSGQFFAIIFKAMMYAWLTGIRRRPAFQMAFWSTLVSWQVAPILIFSAYN